MVICMREKTVERERNGERESEGEEWRERGRGWSLFLPHSLSILETSPTIKFLSFQTFFSLLFIPFPFATFYYSRDLNRSREKEWRDIRLRVRKTREREREREIQGRKREDGEIWKKRKKKNREERRKMLVTFKTSVSSKSYAFTLNDNSLPAIFR